MRCLYCGKELALFKRLRGGEFCSDAHRQRYQEEYTQLALNRLLQTNAAKEREFGDQEAGETGLDEPESPALKRRERLSREETTREETTREEPVREEAAPAEVPELSPAVPAATLKTAVLEPESAPEPEIEFASAESASEELAAVDLEAEPEVIEPGPAPMLGFLVDFPLPPECEPPAPVNSPAPLALRAAAALPRLQPYQPDQDSLYLDRAERLTLSLFTASDFPTPPRERGLELREFVRGVPQVEIHVKPAVESGFQPVKEPFEVIIGGYSPVESADLWLAPCVDLAVADAGIELGDLTRLDFAVTDWGGEEAEAIRAQALAEGPTVAEVPSTEESPNPPEPHLLDSEPAASEQAPSEEPPEMSVKLEPMRIEPAQHQPETLASSRPEPLHFEPVHIDPVFMEKIAGTAVIEESEAPAAEEPAVVEAVVEESGVIQTPAAEQAGEEPSQELAPAPGSITRPLPVTLHGLAPLRGKPVQVFTSAAIRAADLQIPREAGLPLRPVMVLGPAPKLADEPRPEQAVKLAPAATKSEAPKPEIKPRKAEVRVLPIQLKEVKPEPTRTVSVQRPAQGGRVEPAKPDSIKAEPEKPAAIKAEPAKPSPVKVETAAKAAPKSADAAKPAENVKPAEKPKPEEPASPKPAAPLKPAVPAEEMDSLGLPKLAFEQQESFWAKLPAVAKLGLAAGVLALIIGGVFLTSRGSGSAKPGAGVSDDAALVEEPALGNTAGWAQDWFADRAGAKQGRHVDVLRGSLGLRDYRLLLEGQIEHGALGWVFRADNKSFYVEKIQVITPGHDPVIALEHFAVINGVEQQRTQLPIPLQAHLDTLYKVRTDVVGDRFTTWIQDQKVETWTDAQIPAGGVGLYYDANDSFKLRDTLNVFPLRKK